MLEIAVTSALSQTYPEVEVIVGDDSGSSESADRIAPLLEAFPARLRYVKNESRLGQNENVNRLFKLAAGGRLVLLHDDDRLLSDALVRLDSAWQSDTFIAFGTQQIINSDGTVLPKETSELNETYFRQPHNAGVQRSPLESALLQQIPNDGFMVKTEAAQATGYGSDREVGVYCDLDFNLRLTASQRSGKALFVNAFTSQYRISKDAISLSAAAHRYDHPRAAVAMYERVTALALPSPLEPARKVLLSRLASKAAKGYALSGQRRRALRVYLSDFYPLRSRLTRRGLYHLALIISPLAERLRRYPV